VVTAVVTLAAVGVGFALPAPDRLGLWIGAGIALAVQALCYGALWWATRRRPARFLAAWAGGVVMRLLTVVLFGLVGVRLLALPPVPALLGLAGVLFVLLLFEPLGLERAPGVARA
jgi:hypothetical protein